VHAVHPIPPHWLYNGSGHGIVDKVVDEEDVTETVVVTIFVIVLVEVEVEVEVEVLDEEVLVEAATVTYTVLVDVEVGVEVTVMVITATQDRKVSYLPSISLMLHSDCREDVINEEILSLTSSIGHSGHHNLLQIVD
jgi:hypothetical protein